MTEESLKQGCMQENYAYITCREFWMLLSLRIDESRNDSVALAWSKLSTAGLALIVDALWVFQPDNLSVQTHMIRLVGDRQ
ncbi:hypothetical protein RvY_00300 [Ramazzottius varieornatus]|uniref:Uncharacterized protein n=1 Tax=Ramazzottius varieornatus TaxID=947166 RepID=A0A1D1UGF5_RAMVA|nr:hypothetical protein RvY_00300 [Ramazzottius varieornatus]